MECQIVMPQGGIFETVSAKKMGGRPCDQTQPGT